MEHGNNMRTSRKILLDLDPSLDYSPPFPSQVKYSLRELGKLLTKLKISCVNINLVNGHDKFMLTIY